MLTSCRDAKVQDDLAQKFKNDEDGVWVEVCIGRNGHFMTVKSVRALGENECLDFVVNDDSDGNHSKGEDDNSKQSEKGRDIFTIVEGKFKIEVRFKIRVNLIHHLI